LLPRFGGVANVGTSEGEDTVGDIGMASAAWHALGHQLAACRRAAGLNQKRLAGLTAYSRSTIANVETGRQRVGPDFWRRCDDVLGTGDALQQGFSEAQAASRAERAQAVADARYQSMTVTFGQLEQLPEPAEVTLAAGTGSASSVPVLETGTARDPLVVGLLAGALAGHAQAAALFGGELLPLMVRHVRSLRAGFASTRGVGRQRLILTCARYAEFAGWLSQDLGRAGDGQFWTDHALGWAREAGDPEFVSYALMRQSDLAEGRETARRVLDLADAAARVPALGPRARALVIQQRAAGYALDRDVARFERTVEEAREGVEAAAGTDDAPWGLYCTASYVSMQEATGWLHLGEDSRAVTVFERAVSQLPPGDRVDAGLFRARLARAYVRDHRADGAGQAALASLELARATGSQRTWRELALVRRAIGSHPDGTQTARFAAIYDAHTRVVRQS
jgi:transcriptional regulator with XRE-family HTH domain